MAKKKFLRILFGYSRREQSGTLVLVVFVVIVLFFALRSKVVLVSEPGSADSLYTSLLNDSLPAEEFPLAELIPERFNFDPNTIKYSELLSLGLSERQARTLINYRNSGARFKLPSDFRKVYGISDSLQDILIPYINISRPENIDTPSGTGSKTKTGNIKADSTEADLPFSKSKMTPEISIEINSSDSTELRTLPGIGTILSRRIVLYRNLLGGYYSTQQLSEVYGIDSSLCLALQEYTSSDTLFIEKINLNKDDYATIIRHPYISVDMCRGILYYRKVQGNITSLEELVRNRIISEEESLRIKPYISFGSNGSVKN